MGTRISFCVPAAPGFKPKQDVQLKLNNLAANNEVPSVLTAVFFEAARRFMNGDSASTPIEEDIFAILDGLSPELKDVLSCTLSNLNLVPSSLRNQLLSPEIMPETLLTEENISNFLVQEYLDRAGLKLLGNKSALTNPRAGLARPIGSGEFRTFAPAILAINDIRTGAAILLDVPKPEEVERICVLNAQNQLICTNQTTNCPGNVSIDGAVCFVVQKVTGGSLVKLTGYNFFSTDAKVILANKDQPNINRTVSTIVYGDLDTPLRDEQGNIIADERVHDQILFTIPEDLPDGIYSIRVQVNNTDINIAPIGLHTSDPEFLRILPSPTTTFQVLAERLHCFTNTSGPGSDEVALTFLTSLLVQNPNSPAKVDILPLTRQEFRFDEVDSGEDRPINFALVQANNLAGAIISVVGFEVDDEDAFKQQITEFSEAFKAALENVYAKTAGSVAGGVAGAISAVAGATFAVGSVIVAAAALVITVAVAIFYAWWAPADPIMTDSIGLTLIDLATLTDGVSPPPPKVEYNAPNGIHVVVEPINKGLEYEELRGNISDEEESIYQLILKYSRS